MLIPWPVYIWIILSSAAVTYDFIYIQTRPQSFVYDPKDLTFQPYMVYQFFDTLKINMQDQFVVIQSWLNAVEVVLGLLTIVLSLLPFKSLKFACAIMLIVISSFVFWKTVIYLWYDRPFVTDSLKRFYTIAVAFYYLTIGCFIVFPLMTIYSISKRIHKAIIP